MAINLLKIMKLPKKKDYLMLLKILKMKRVEIRVIQKEQIVQLIEELQKLLKKLNSNLIKMMKNDFLNLQKKQTMTLK